MSSSARIRSSVLRCFLGSLVAFSTITCAVLPAHAQDDSLHIWAGKLDRPGAEKWVENHLSREQKFIDKLLAVKGTRTVENTLRPFDDAQNELSIAGFESYLMFAVASQKEVRDAGQDLAQKVQQANTALSLNQDVYTALKAVNV